MEDYPSLTRRIIKKRKVSTWSAEIIEALSTRNSSKPNFTGVTQKMSDKKDDIVYIGQKTAMNYVMACLTVIQSGFEEITLKARGRAISRAVDVAEILRNRFMKDKLEIKSIITGTEVLERQDRGKFSVSTIDIILKVI